MAGWKKLVDGKSLQIILLQETHVATTMEAERLSVQWSRGWGQKHDPQRPLSFWSTAGHRMGGVAVLLHPALQGEFSIDHASTTERTILLEAKARRILNIYAPNHRTQRESFFRELAKQLTPDKRPFWMAGDFNCVLHPEKERVTNGDWCRHASESPELELLVHQLSLTDVERERGMAPTLNRITYWQGGSGAKLDRCYANPAASGWTHETELVVPAGPTDHRGVLVWMRDPCNHQVQRPLAPSLYPIRARDPEAIERLIGKELGHTVVAAEVRQCDWETFRGHVSATLRMIKKTEQKRAKRQRQRADARQRKAIRTLKDLIQYVGDRVKRKEMRHRGATLLERSGSSEHLFRRFVRHDQRTLVPELQRDQAKYMPATATTADVMATEWQPLLGQVHSTTAPQDQATKSSQFYTVPTTARLTHEDNEALMATITEEEVAATIRELGTHKAAGPDRLGNDFYRDWSSLVVPTLTVEFNKILHGAAMPPSFAAAIIVPIPKDGDATKATNYRPISLLQSSYKILTKLLANRVQRSLDKVINEDQNGFVRGRALANNVTLMKAMFAQAIHEPETSAQDSPVIILLDFKKAYDTLDRHYIRHALLAFGYTTAFADLVDRLHHHTTAQFLVNGELSAEFEIVTGIRQGCPLAPLLFLIAAETLKHAIDHDERIRGIQLPGAFQDHRHVFSAFVDDSAVFLEQGAMVAALTEVLDEFATLSGLQVQPTKSHAFILNDANNDTAIGPFPTVMHGDTATYLGVEIGMTNLDVINWTKRCASIRTRLGILSKYTMGVTDRVQVINIACIPALLFTAQFFSPPRTIQADIEAMWRQFVWNGTTINEPRRAHKVAAEIMHLPTKMAGVGLRDYRVAMLAQAATTILSWNARKHDKYWEAQHNLLRERVQPGAAHVTTFPSTTVRVTPSSMRGQRDLQALGYHVVNETLASGYPHPEQLRAAKTLELARATTPWNGLRWLTSTLGCIKFPAEEQRRLTQLAQLNYAQMPAEMRTFWPTFPWYANAWLVDEHGQPLRRRDYASIKIHLLGELRLTKHDDTTYYFTNPAGPVDTMKAATIRRVAQWLKVIIVNTAALAYDTAPPDNRRVYLLQRHPEMDEYEWRIAMDGGIQGRKLTEKQTDPHTTTCTEPAVQASIGSWGQPLQLEPSTTPDHLRDLTSHVDGHPLLQHGPTMMRLAASSVHSRATLRGVVLAHSGILHQDQQVGIGKVIVRLQRQRLVNPVLATPLQAGGLTRLHRKPWGVTAYQHFLYYRLTLGALNLRDRDGNKHSCPFTFCAHTEPATETHILWDCIGAQAFWAQLLRRWQPASHTALTPTAAAANIFGPRPPDAAPALRQELEQLSRHVHLIARTMTDVWREVTACATQQLWLLRNAAVFNAEQPTLTEHLATVTVTVANQLDAIRHRLDHDHRHDDKPQARVRMSFDGGSRGNPGHTGTGSVILEAKDGESWEIVWWDAHYMGDNQTNNAAEHTGLLRGVRECVRRYAAHPTPIHIIGDSQLILDQATGVAHCHNHALRALCIQTQDQLRQLSVYTVHHTLRAGNKMADLLANHAMDTHCTTTSTDKDSHLYAALTEHQLNDSTTQWTNRRPPTDILTCLNRHHQTTAHHRTTHKRRHHEIV